MKQAASKTRVYFDATRLLTVAGKAPTGIDRVDRAYVEHLSHDERVDLQFVATQRWKVRGLSKAERETVLSMPRPRESSGPAIDALFTWLASAPKAAARSAPAKAALPDTRSLMREIPRRSGLVGVAETQPDAVYINTSHGGLFRPALATWLRRTRIRPLFFIHDLIPIRYPEFNRPREPHRHEQRLKIVSELASHVIVNSQHTRDDLLKYLADKQLRVPPVAIAMLGTSLLSGRGASRQAPAGAAPYFVMLSTIEPRKNHLLALEVWRRCVEQLGSKSPRLVLVGKRGWENQQILNLLERMPAARDYVYECPSLSDTELAAVLRGCRGVLSPSFAEGYGLPVAEALSLGVPVIASDIAAHREVGGNAAEYIDPLDGPAWMRAVLEYAHDSSRREHHLGRLKSYKAPTWGSHFDTVLPLVWNSSRP